MEYKSRFSHTVRVTAPNGDLVVIGSFPALGSMRLDLERPKESLVVDALSPQDAVACAKELLEALGFVVIAPGLKIAVRER